MSKRVWTADQQNAINARGGTLLLSAAAGSGKTAVLVERIIKLLTDGNDPVHPEELLVVTFTNAAAAEMRTRIAAAIDGLIKNDPANNHYRKIKMTLPQAQISTIDSFCIKLVRENFHAAEIAPDFVLLDNSEQKILIADAMAKTLDTLCADSPEVYDMLNSMTSYGRDDSSLSAKILRLYEFSLSHPFPELWLDSIEAMYSSKCDLRDSVWGKIIISECITTLEFCLSLTENALADASSNEVIAEKYTDAILSETDHIKTALETVKTKSWDDIILFLRSRAFGKLPAAPRGYGSDPAKLAAEAKFKRAKSLYEKTAEYFCADSVENEEDMEKLRPVISALANAVRSFGENYMRLKDERSGYTFGDIMHKALKLLVKSENGNAVKTALALDLSRQYKEILIDEYQDTNEAQDMLFSALSDNNKNLFTVGDVKQSIYGFRLAMPEIFIKKSREYSHYSTGEYPAKIILGTNFRSRKGILDNINFLFRNLMSDDAGGMDYTNEDALYFGGLYPEDDEPAVQLRFLENSGIETEAAYVAKIIDDMIKSGAAVTLGDNKTRKARPGDFCILLRSMKGKAEYYEKALNARNIKSSSEKKTDLFDSPEVRIFISLLKIISNPTDDVSMLSVMFSPLYGFTPDELADMKKNDRKLSVYSCLKADSETNEKSRKLISDLKRYRRTASVMRLSLFLRTLLDITGFLSVAGALKNGKDGRMNLLMLCSFASSYEENSSGGLDGFIRYIAKSAENGADIPSASDVSDSADVVRIYSIHKSKGLEFPFVILADCAKKFNMSDRSDEMIVSPSAGVGMLILNDEKMQKYPTIAHAASKIAVGKASLSEELRVLYVAMTRAKEKLIAVSSVGNIGKTVEKTFADLIPGQKPFPGAVLASTSYMQWFLLGFMSHPDMKKIADFAGGFESDYESAESRLSVITEAFNEGAAAEIECIQTQPDEKLISVLRERAEYKYPYVIPADARPKRVASDFENKKITAEYFSSSKPSFLNAKKMTAAEVGTANHLFLQHIDFFAKNAYSELKRMRTEKILTQEQCEVIRLKDCDSFLNSELCGRIRNAEKVLREKEFTVEIPLGKINPDVDDNVKNEKILVLGVADLVFIEGGKAVVVDYKTDRTKTREQFIESYGGQLKMYKTAMEQLLDVPVAEMIIYSLKLGEAIKTEE